MKSKGALFILFLATAAATACFYFDEGYQSFDFLAKPAEAVSLIILTTLFTILPLTIYFALATTRFRKAAFYLSMVGFFPPIILLLFIFS
jgi:hypothetical protein